MRLLLFILLAVSMAVAPAPGIASAKADASMANMACGMAHHDKMGCCGPDCAVTSPAAVLAAGVVELSTVEPCSVAATARLALVLRSIDPAATDPPPRTTVS